MQQLSAVGGALRYEFWMQLRRSSVWILLALLSTLLFALWYLFESGDLHGYYNKEQHVVVPPSQHDPVLFWAQVLGMLLPLGVGLVLADRLARDRSTHVDEILDTVPSSLGARLLGKYLGSTLATLVPVLLIYASVILYIVTHARFAIDEPKRVAARIALATMSEGQFGHCQSEPAMSDSNPTWQDRPLASTSVESPKPRAAASWCASC